VSQPTIAFRLQGPLGGPTGVAPSDQSQRLIVAIKHVHGWLASAGTSAALSQHPDIIELGRPVQLKGDAAYPGTG
jgi:hypothetical protein